MYPYKEKQKLCAERRLKLIKNATESELIFKARLDYLKIRYLFQKGFIAGDNFVICDFYLPKYKLVIEIDGKYHNTPKQQKRDRDRDCYLQSRKIRCKHVKNEDVSVIDILSLIAKYD